MKKQAAGIIITNGVSLVMGHSTGNKHWDIPKGRLDDGETEIDAAIRETQEESGLIFSKEGLIELGMRTYGKDRELTLFLAIVHQLPDPSTLNCSSMVHWDGYDPFPELDQFKLVEWAKIADYVTKNMLARLVYEHPRILKFMWGKYDSENGLPLDQYRQF